MGNVDNLKTIIFKWRLYCILSVLHGCWIELSQWCINDSSLFRVGQLANKSRIMDQKSSSDKLNKERVMMWNRQKGMQYCILDIIANVQWILSVIVLCKINIAVVICSLLKCDNIQYLELDWTKIRT